MDSEGGGGGGGGVFGWCRLWHLVHFDNDIFLVLGSLQDFDPLWGGGGRGGGGSSLLCSVRYMYRISLIIGRTFLHEDPH